MDQNKILWIVAAVGAFLLVVLGAALIFYTPKPTTEPQVQNLGGIWTSSRDSSQNQNAVGLNAQDYSTPNPATYPYSENSEAGIYLGSQQESEQSNQETLQEQAVMTDGQTVQTLNLYAQNANLYSESTTIDLNDLSRVTNANQTVVQTSNIRDVNASSQSIPLPTSQTQVAKAPAPASTQAKAPAPVAQVAKTTSTTAASATSVSVKSPVKLEDKFWIQASSFSSKINAEELKTNLTKENFVSEIFTFTDDKNNLFYRVRIGPYTTKSEAEYWQGQLAKVASLKGTETYITNSSLKK